MSPARPPPYLSALHLLSLVEGVTTLASGTHHPKPSWPAGPAVRGQGRGSGNPLTALGERARAKGLSKQRSHGAGGQATRVLSHPAATAGRRFTGNRKMCTSHCWNRLEGPPEEGGGKGQTQPLRLPKTLMWGHSGSLLEVSSPLSTVHGPVCSGLNSGHVHTHLSLPRDRRAHSLGLRTHQHYCQLWQEPASLAIRAGTLCVPKGSSEGTGSLRLACTLCVPTCSGKDPHAPPSKCAGTGRSRPLLPEHTHYSSPRSLPMCPHGPPLLPAPIPIGLRDLPGRTDFGKLWGPP